MTDSIFDFYRDPNLEDKRLLSDQGRIEWSRTLDVFSRYLPVPPAVVGDVGGGTGTYAAYLLKKGYQVHLVDLMPRHVELARKRMAAINGSMSWSASIGDAKSLNFPANFFDVVLLMGPLYHLQKKADRIHVLKEGFRVLRTGGLLCCIIISKFASLLDGLHSGFMHDPEFRDIIANDLKNGCHENPTGKVDYFTRAYFQHPDELSREVRGAGFGNIRILAIEGILWAANDYKAMTGNRDAWKSAFEFMRIIEEERCVVGASPHIMGVARKETG